jgi:hypothetical protein
LIPEKPAVYYSRSGHPGGRNFELLNQALKTEAERENTGQA